MTEDKKTIEGEFVKIGDEWKKIIYCPSCRKQIPIENIGEFIVSYKDKSHESYLKGREDEREKILEIVKKQKSIMESYKMYICTKCSTISREPAEICPECGNKPYDSKLFVWHYAVDGTMVFSLLTNLENQIKRLDEE